MWAALAIAAKIFCAGGGDTRRNVCATWGKRIVIAFCAGTRTFQDDARLFSFTSGRVLQFLAEVVTRLISVAFSVCFVVVVGLLDFNAKVEGLEL